CYKAVQHSGSKYVEHQSIKPLKCVHRDPDNVNVNPSLAVQGTNDGSFGKYFVSTWGTIPRALKDGRGFWAGDYWGVISIGANQGLVPNVPKSFADLKKPEYKNKVALNGSPLTSGSAIAGVFAASLANGGSLNDVGPGIDYFANLK